MPVKKLVAILIVKSLLLNIARSSMTSSMKTLLHTIVVNLSGFFRNRKQHVGNLLSNQLPIISHKCSWIFIKCAKPGKVVVSTSPYHATGPQFYF